MVFDPTNLNVLADKDGRGLPRTIKHIAYPFLFDATGKRARDAVQEYLAVLSTRLRVPDGAIGFLAHTGDDRGRDGDASRDDGLQLRWSVSYPAKDDGWVFLIQQTQLVNGRDGPAGIDVEGAGLRVIVESVIDGRFAIRGLVSTLIYDFPMLDPAAVDVAPDMRGVEVNAILASFGLPRQAAPGDEIPVPLVLHRYDPRAMDLPVAPPVGAAKVAGCTYYPARILRVPPVPADVPAGRAWELTAWVPEWGPVPLRSIALSTHAMPPVARGYVFTHDPVTRTGLFDKLGTKAAPDALDNQRSMVRLTNLRPPGPLQPWKLVGDRVAIVDGTSSVPGGIGVEPPASMGLPEFFYGSRTNDFAAVNAYHHVESMVGLLDEFGHPLFSFPMFTLPLGGYVKLIEVLHRAAMFPGACQEGNCINAQAELIPTGINHGHRIQLRFALADLSRNPGTPANPIEPLGIACDSRVVWHEFCHALIAAATNELEFPFAHSAGDALAAIMCDPHSKLAAGLGLNPDDRFSTYPWGTTPARRHDRRVADGWSWAGPLGTDQGYSADWRDDSGYAREQVLATTLFRVYQAIGGDAWSNGAPNTPVRARAARYAAYLIVRAIYSLGPAIIVPVANAAAFATTLQHADSATTLGPAPQSRVGGTVHKVIDWAFQQQGDPPLPSISGLAVPDVYVYHSKRLGGYDYTEQWETDQDGIAISQSPTGSDAPPIVGTQNYVHVRVDNRTEQTASSVTVSVYVGKRADARKFPDPAHWTKLALVAGGVGTHPVGAEQSFTFGPYAWTPAARGAYKVLAVAEADGDWSNVNPSSTLPCATTATPLGDLVPLDNNLGLRTVRTA